MATEIWVNNNVDWSSFEVSDIYSSAISQEMPQPSITKIHLKTTYRKFHSNFLGANDLTLISVLLWYQRFVSIWRLYLVTVEIPIMEIKHCYDCLFPKWISMLVRWYIHHYSDVIMSAIASQITSLTIVFSTVYSDADQRKHQSSASWAFVRGIHRGSVNSQHKWPVTWKMFPFDNVIIISKKKSKPFGSLLTAEPLLMSCPGLQRYTKVTQIDIRS